MRIGAHVSASGGLDKAIDRARAIGAEAAQIFVTPPQGWRVTAHTPETIEGFVRKAAENNITPVYLHGVYLVNLASESEENRAKGIESLTHYMNFCPSVRASGVIFHVGSHKGAGLDAVMDRIIDAVATVLEQSPQNAWLCLENNAGHGQQIGARFEDLGAIVARIGDPRLRVCLDTCHALASGYDIVTRDGLEQTLDAFDAAIGLEKLAVVHANDSKSPLGGKLDRHENIGDGHIGLEGWRTIIAHPAFHDLPLLLEVPGIDGKSGPDAENVRRLKAIREEMVRRD